MKKPVAILGCLAAIIGVCIVGFLLIQLIPYGHNHTNPPVVQEPNWDSQTTQALARRACMDCHSNQTVWPWFTSIAPGSWLVQLDVDRGRRSLNFSEWQTYSQNSRVINRITRSIQGGDMPPFQYLILHPEANLTAKEKQLLIDGLNASVK